MKVYIEIKDEDLERLEEISQDKLAKKQLIDEKLEHLKGNVKKLKKDEVYLDLTYKQVLLDIEESAIKDRIAKEVFDKWKKKAKKQSPSK